MKLDVKLQLPLPFLQTLLLFLSLAFARLQLSKPLLFLVEATLPRLRWGPLVVASYCGFEVRDSRMIHLDEGGIVRLEPIVPAKVGLHRLGGMMCSEDLSRQPPHRFSQEPVDPLRGYPVKD